jgi:hypothetical protein
MEAALSVRHDLGKYVCFEARWLDETASAAELRAALQADLGHTRRGPAGDEDCTAVWARLRPDVAGLGVEDIDALVAELGRALPRLPEMDLDGLRQVAGVARSLSELCRHLAARAED